MKFGSILYFYCFLQNNLCLTAVFSLCPFFNRLTMRKKDFDNRMYEEMCCMGEIVIKISTEESSS